MIWMILGWLVFGLVAGFIARALVPGKDDIGYSERSCSASSGRSLVASSQER
jgi:hypothetical protein